MSEKIRKSALVILLVLVSCSFSLLAGAAEPDRARHHPHAARVALAGLDRRAPTFL